MTVVITANLIVKILACIVLMVNVTLVKKDII